MNPYDKKTFGAITSKVAKYTNHEKYNHDRWVGVDTNPYDITMIELTRDIDLTKNIPACIAKTSDTTTFDDKMAWVYGKNYNVVDKRFSD